MDKFVIKQPKTNIGSLQQKSPKKKVRQSTLQSLSGVVVIEELEEAKRVLEDSDKSCESKIKILNKLLVKKPAKEILIKVGIGKTVRKLGKVPDSNIEEEQKLKSLAYRVYRNWRREIERKVELSKKKIEVSFDKESSDSVSSAIRLFLPLLGDRDLCEKVEKELRVASGGLVGSQYRRRVREVVFGLRREPQLLQEAKEGTISARQLIQKIN